jgi:hypothetical protein
MHFSTGMMLDQDESGCRRCRWCWVAGRTSALRATACNWAAAQYAVRESHAPRREPIHVRRRRLLVATEVAHPVIQVVDGDEEDVGFLVGGERCRGSS